MTAVAEAGPIERGGLGFGVVGLLALVVFINYVDRGALATAAPLIKDALKLSNTQVGLLLSAFFWTYTPSQILAGWLSERINAYRTLAIGLVIWSLATAASALATGFWMLIALRLVLGIGESAAFPCSSRLLGQHLPSHRLGAANGLIGVGLALGPAFGTFAGGLLMAEVGWRPVFLVFGAASLLWLWPWLRATGGASTKADGAGDEAAPAFTAILRRRELWGASLGHFGQNYVFYFVITWLPLYLVKARGLSVSEMAELGGLIYVVYAVSCVVTGWLSDRWMRAGASANRVRKTVALVGNLGAALAMAGCALGDGRAAIVSLFVAAVAFGLCTPTLYAIAQTLAGPRAAGKWVAVQNAMGNLAGIIAPVVTGLVVDRTGRFTWAFLAAGAMALAAIVGWGLVVRKVAPIDWRSADSA